LEVAVSKLIDLVQQHIRESEARLRHVDELMNRTNQALANAPVAANADTRVRQIQAVRDRLPLELDDTRCLPRGDVSETVRRGEGLKGALETVGMELEKALTAVLEVGP
jgi:hypothetical protein